MLLYIAEVKRFRRNLGFEEFDVMVLSEYSIKSKLGKIFVVMVLSEYSVKSKLGKIFATEKILE